MLMLCLGWMDRWMKDLSKAGSVRKHPWGAAVRMGWCWCSTSCCISKLCPQEGACSGRVLDGEPCMENFLPPGKFFTSWKCLERSLRAFFTYFPHLSKAEGLCSSV